MSDLSPSLLDRNPLPNPRPWWQKRAFKIGITLLGLLLVIAIMTMNVAKYETHLAKGETVLLELAPVDPRGFMQGDYMTLRYALEREVLDGVRERSGDNRLNDTTNSIDSSEGYVIVRLDDNNVGQFVRLVDSYTNATLAANEMAIHYRVRNGSLKLATNAFFFQEGHAESFETAEYGLFRVNDKGEPLLTDMVDGEFAVIKGVSINDESTGDKGIENMGRQGTGM